VNRAVSLPAAALLFLAVAGASAGNALAETKTFSLDEAVEHALIHNGELKAARSGQEAAEAGTVRAGLYPNPVLELQGTTGAMTGSSDESSMELAISQEVLLGGKRAKRLEAAEREVEVVRWWLADRERLTALEVKMACADLFLAQQRLDLAKQAAELGSQLLAVTRERFAAGDIPELEVNLARVEMARSGSERVAAEREILPVRSRLATLMGLEAGIEAAVVPPPDQQSFTAGVAGLVARARQNRPDIKALTAQQAMGEAEVSLARSEGVSNLTVGLFVAHERSTDAIGADEETTRDTILGVRLSMPLALFDRNKAGIRQAGARRDGAEVRLFAARVALEREVEAEHARMVAAEEVLRLYAQDILPRLKENLALVQEAYGLGEADILTVIEEQKKYVEVHGAYLEAAHARQTARARLEAAVGASLDELTTGGVQ
jgi:cobalt-zinc-cadmium efflux system outer membrane protein